MKAEAIFGPVIALAVWTGLVLLVAAYRRIGAVASGRLRSSAFRVGESPDVPPEIAVGNRNFMNLLEMPVLFYVACLSLYVTRQVDAAIVWLGWGYFGLRVVHSLIHLTVNRVIPRLLAFAASNLVLLAMWVLFARRVL